jgi:hypothetical protein
VRLARSAEQLGRAAHDLVLWDILEVLGQTPPVSERIDDLPVAFAPETVLEGRVHLSAFGQRSLPQFVDHVGRDRERPVRSAERKRRDSSKLGELIGDQHARAAEAELDLHEPSIRDGNAVADLGAERALYQSAAHAASRTTMCGVTSVTSNLLV